MAPSLDLRVDPDRALPPAMQIVEAVLDAVASGVLAADDRLPSVRQAATQALVNPNTVARAFRELEVMGVVEGRAGTGVFVTRTGPEVARRRRRRETLAAFRRAADEALRSGHQPAVVLDEAHRAIRRARGGGARASVERGEEETS